MAGWRLPRWSRIFLVGLGLVVSASLMLLWWALGTWLPKESWLATSKAHTAQAAAPKDTISILTYNIAHGQGIKENPTDWRDEAFTRKKLAEVAAVVKKTDADIVFLQEVDLDSDRTHHINEAFYLVSEAAYPYFACALMWDKNYVPFPVLPIEHQLGQVRAANCILSRYPLKEHARLILQP